MAPQRTDKDLAALAGNAGPLATALTPPSLLLARDAAAPDVPGSHSLAGPGMTRPIPRSAIRYGRACGLDPGRKRGRATGESGWMPHSCQGPRGAVGSCAAAHLQGSWRRFPRGIAAGSLTLNRRVQDRFSVLVAFSNRVCPDMVCTWRVATLDFMRNRHADNTAPKAKTAEPTILDLPLDRGDFSARAR
jgi:hypothetical protein